MKALDTNENKTYKILGCELAEWIDMKKVMERLQIQMEKRARKLVGEELYDKNLAKA